MAKELKPNLQGGGLHIAILVAQFNQFVTQNLLGGARECLDQHGVQDEDILIAWVPGAFELPLAARAIAETRQYDAIICLGAVIRGETSHFDLVAGQASSGIARVAQDSGIPVMFGLLATESMDQAINRAGGKSGNLGYSAALGAIEMAQLLRQLRALSSGQGAR